MMLHYFDSELFEVALVNGIILYVTLIKVVLSDFALFDVALFDTALFRYCTI